MGVFFTPISVVNPFHESLLGAKSKPGLARKGLACKDHVKDPRRRSEVTEHMSQVCEGTCYPHMEVKITAKEGTHRREECKTAMTVSKVSSGQN